MPGGEPHRHERAVGVTVSDEPFRKFGGEPIVSVEVQQLVAPPRHMSVPQEFFP